MAIALVPLATVAIALRSVITSAQDRAFTNMENIIIAKQHNLTDWIENTAMFGDTLARTTDMQTYITSLASGGDEQAASKVNDLLFSFQETHKEQYHHVFIIDASRTIVVSPNRVGKVRGSPSSHLGEDTSHNIWVQEAFQNGEVTISDYSSWTESDHNHQMLFYPLETESGATVALIGFELQIPYGLALLSRDTNLGTTGRIFMVSEDKVHITYELQDTLTTINNEGITHAEETTGIYSGILTNELGEEVVGAYQKHSKYPWILAVEISTDEAFAEIEDIRNFFITSLIVSVALILLCAHLLVLNLVKPMTKMTEIAESITHGELDAKWNIETKDEFGAMAAAYNTMAKAILESKSMLEQKVRERTQELEAIILSMNRQHIKKDPTHEE